MTTTQEDAITKAAGITNQLLHETDKSKFMDAVAELIKMCSESPAVTAFVAVQALAAATQAIKRRQP